MSRPALYIPEKGTKHFLNNYICSACNTEFKKIAKTGIIVFLFYPEGSKVAYFSAVREKAKLIKKNNYKFDSLKEHLKRVK